MYLVSWCEEQHILEASLGGRVTQDEMAVFVEEIQDVIDMVNEQPFMLLLDYSRSKPFDHASNLLLGDLKEFCIENGAAKVVNIVRDTDDVGEQMNLNFQRVMAGIEEFVEDPAKVRWTAPAAQSSEIRFAA